MSEQRNTFLGGEGDAWFVRNLTGQDPRLERVATSRLIESLLPFADQIRTIIEVGSGSGSELQKLCVAFDAEGIGVDPSATAVSHGNERAAKATIPMTLHVGTADKLPAAEASVDLLFFGFCLYLVDRHDLLRALAEAHRVVRAGGFVAILDFDPAVPHRRIYAHRDGLHSYKQDYAQILLATQLYSVAAKHGLSHVADHFEADANERVALTILYKETHPYLDWQGKPVAVESDDEAI